MKIIVIGAVAGGTTAAVTARRHDPQAEITVYEKDHDISYVSCGMPYYLAGDVESESTLAPRGPEFFWKKHQISIHIQHEVVAIDASNKKVRVHNLVTSQTFEDSYDRLIIATGASVIIPPIPGVKLPHVFPLRRMEEMRQIKHFFDANHPTKAVVIGTGFIGLEMAETMIRRGISVQLVERLPQVSPSIDPDMSRHVLSYLESKNIPVHLNKSAVEITSTHVILDDGNQIEADFVLLATGVRPNTALAKTIGIEMALNGGILVDAEQRTSIPEIYATGDCVLLPSVVSQIPIYRPLGSTANKTGRVVGENVVGGHQTFPGIAGTSIYRLFELTVAQTGLGEAEARAHGLKAIAYEMSSEDRPLFMGGREMNIKLIVEETTLRLLGAQIVGFEGVDKRIDVVATAITFGAKLDDLISLDLAYTPVFNTSTDPLGYAGLMMKASLRKRS